MGRMFKDRMVRPREIKKGDFVHGLEVTELSYDDDMVTIESYKEDSPPLYLRVADDHHILISQAVKIPDSKCITCGERDIKYAQRLQCNTCYQRDRRAAQAAPDEHSNSVAVALGPSYARDLTQTELTTRRRARIETR